MEPKICRREVRAGSRPVHHLTPLPTRHDSVTKHFLEEVQGSIWSMDSCPILTFDIIWKRVIIFEITPAEKLPSATFLVQALPGFQGRLHPAAALADCDQWTLNNEHYNGSHLMYSTELYGLFLIGNGPKTNPWPLMAWKTITFGSPCASSVHQSSGAPWPLSS